MFDKLLPTREAATSRVLKTSVLLASVQVELPHAFYVRPGVDVGDHAFAVPNPAADDGEALSVRHESGPAAGLALGRTIVVARVVPVAVEGVALWSRGGEATGTRCRRASRPSRCCGSDGRDSSTDQPEKPRPSFRGGAVFFSPRMGSSLPARPGSGGASWESDTNRPLKAEKLSAAHLFQCPRQDSNL
jgi:hypothetical protein